MFFEKQHGKPKEKLKLKIYRYKLDVAPLTVAVTTRNTTFSVGNPELNLHLPLESWEGGHTQDINHY